jgi:predicted nucleic acid-binding Zn ribbon protein
MTSSKKKRSEFTPIGSVIGHLLNQHRPTTTRAMLDIWDIWEKTVGPEIAGNAKPAAINGPILMIHVSNSSWLHHLRFIEKDLIGRLNQAMGGNILKNLKFKIGPI